MSSGKKYKPTSVDLDTKLKILKDIDSKNQTLTDIGKKYGVLKNCEKERFNRRSMLYVFFLTTQKTYENM